MQTVPFSVTSRFCRIGCSLHFKVPPVRIPAEKRLLEHTLQNVNLQQIRQSNYGATIWTRAVCSRATGMEVGRNSWVTQRWIPPFIGVLKKAEFSAKCSLNSCIIHNSLPVFPCGVIPPEIKPWREFLNHQTRGCRGWVFSQPHLWAMTLKYLDSPWGSKGHLTVGRCWAVSALWVAEISHKPRSGYSKPIPQGICTSSLSPEHFHRRTMFPFSSEQNGRGEVKSTLVGFIRTKKQSKAKKQTQSSSLSSLPCYENAFIFAGLLTIFQDGTSHTVSSGTADIVSAGRQPLSGLYFTKILYKAFL